MLKKNITIFTILIAIGILLPASLFPKAKKIKEIEEVIPGLMPVDVYLNLTNKGFSKKGPELWSSGIVYWQLHKVTNSEEMTVEIYGKSANSVYKIDAVSSNYLNLNSKTHQQFLGYIATLPYKNSKPNQARLWVIENIDHNASTIIGNVKFEIFANSDRMRILEIQYIDTTKTNGELHE